MKLTFRQGIARYQTDVYATPTFLRKSVPAGDFIDLIVSPDPTIIIFAHRGASYVVEESKTVTNAWGPFTTNGATKYLYWDLNLLDASLTRGTTNFAPIVSGTTPNNPGNDQHWYDTVNSLMKVWNGSKWVEKLRVFAATYSSSGIINSMPLGSQVGATGTFEAGNIVLDAFSKPLRQSDGSFVTSATPMTIVNAASKAVKFETEIFSGMADEYLPKFHFVQARPNRRIILGRSDDWKSRIVGLVTEDLFQSEVGNIITDGLVRNEQWNWPNDKVGRPVFCGITGEITLEPPATGVNQVVGYVYDKDSIVVNIQQPTILDDITQEQLVAPQNPENPPQADFSVSATSGSVPLVVKFTNTSLHAPTSLEWDIGNYGTLDGTGNELTYTFNTAGTYTVRLRARNSYGFDDEIKTNVITVTQSNTGTKTNLGIQLGGPLQVTKAQQFTVSIIVNNDGLKNATQVGRVVTVEDLGSGPPVLSNLPTGSTTMRVMQTTVITLPVLATLATGQYANASFSITAPNVAGNLVLRAAVLSPETDSTLSDNLTTLSIKVK